MNMRIQPFLLNRSFGTHDIAMFRRPSGRTGALILALFAVLSVSACSGADNSSSSEPERTSTTIASSDAVILNAYRSYWDAYVAAANPMNPEDPRLADSATGQALNQVRTSFLGYQIAGSTIRGTFELSPKVVTSDADGATVSDCYLDKTLIYDSNGNAQGSQDTERQSVESTLLLQDGRWKVATVSHKGSGCVPS